MIEENITPAEAPTNSEFSILELGINLVKTSQKNSEEKNLIIIGDKASGKTTLLNAIIQTQVQKENYSPTCGINYSYIRHSGAKKHILNIYEIGGGIKNLNLISTIINERNIKNTSFILTLDFSQPSKILKSFQEYLKELNSILKTSFDQDTLIEIIENKRYRYKDINSNDFKRISIFPAEIIVVGNKYDCLEKIDAEKIKWTCRSLRFFCHLNSLSLLYFKAGDQKLEKIFKNLIASMAFSNIDYSYSQKNDILPLYILYGNDNLNEIGDPKVMQQGNRDFASLWEDTFYTIFPNNNVSEIENLENLIKFEDSLRERYKEPRIDEELKNFE